eukprot:6025875-Pleurochrysis_carterae.AAC.2
MKLCAAATQQSRAWKRSSSLYAAQQCAHLWLKATRTNNVSLRQHTHPAEREARFPQSRARVREWQHTATVPRCSPWAGGWQRGWACLPQEAWHAGVGCVGNVRQPARATPVGATCTYDTQVLRYYQSTRIEVSSMVAGAEALRESRHEPPCARLCLIICHI